MSPGPTPAGPGRGHRLRRLPGLVRFPGGRRASRLVAVLGVGAAAVAAAFAIPAGSSTSGHTVVAEFTNAGSILPGNTVRVDGVDAGTVQKAVLRHNVAWLYLRLKPGFWPIHTDATAQVRPESLLGERFVDLHAGSPAAPALADGGSIPPSRTSDAVNLQTVLNSLNNPTSSSLAVLLASLGKGVAGRGKDEAAAIRALAPALGNTTGLLRLLDHQNRLLTSVIDRVQPVTSALATRRGATLGHLVASTNGVLGATSTAQRAMALDLQRLPGTLATARAAFAQLGGLSDQATPALASLTPLTGHLRAVSNELSAFGNAAGPALRDLQPVLARAHTLIHQSGPVVAQLKAAGPAALADARAAVPIVRQNVAHLNSLFGFIKNWTLATQDYDATSHYFRFFVQGAASDVTGPAGVTGAPPAPSAPPTPRVPTVPTPPGLPHPTGPSPAPGLPPPPATPAPSVPVPGPSATGLTATQEQSMLQYFMGGG